MAVLESKSVWESNLVNTLISNKYPATIISLNGNIRGIEISWRKGVHRVRDDITNIKT
jgi:hypothetical protein